MASRKDQREAARQERVTQEQAAAAGARRKRMSQLGFAGALIALAVVGGAIAISQSGGGSGGNPSDVAASELVAKQLQGIPQNGEVLGDPSAKVTVTEFGDPQCPVCKAFSEQVAPSLISGPVRGGQAKYEFKPWLIIGPDSKPAAEAALAAGKQGHFFNYIELFYRNQGEENSGYVTDKFMTAIANAAGVPDIGEWNQDRGDPAYPRELAAINGEANKLGLTGTPSIVVSGPSGRKVFTSIPAEPEIEAAVKAVGAGG
jgi:protein-disulfide isomerase